MVIICSSSSSGSTLLSNLLNRHPLIASGEELGFFSKPIFYDDFSRLKRLSFLIRRYGISSNPYFDDRSILRNLDSYGLNTRIGWKWVKASSTIQELSSKFERYILESTEKKIWVEKTPENIYLLKKFLSAFPQAMVLHIVRDPRDVVLSLMKRGFSFEYAGDIWLSSVAAIQPFRSNKNILEIRYEDLIIKHESILQKICSFFNIPFNKSFFVEDKYVSKGILRSKGFDSWGADPSQPISLNSVDKFKQLPKDFFSRLYHMKLTKTFADILGCAEFNIQDLMNRYGYDVPEQIPPLTNLTARATRQNLKQKRGIAETLKQFFITRYIETETPIKRVMI